jgi:hypothetical protein
MQDFISEHDLKTVAGWLRYQAVDAATLTPEELTTWRRFFEDARQRSAASPRVGLMKLQPVAGEHRYAVAVREGSDLWLTLWVRRSRKGDFFVMLPRGDRDWDPHMSYHLDGTTHMKSHDRKVLPPRKHQPLTGIFQGSEHLGVYCGQAPKGVGAVCDPNTLFRGCRGLAGRIGTEAWRDHGGPGAARPQADGVSLDQNRYPPGVS